ncbi:hypothetical protein LY01_02898 [Nonlabens xylanidelens]|uniref:Uncharacterized protein n=1 Tax=Nonlabens xylanidelens TaxID=191564 RepID=A0A2S6IF82_9FLAO|nr:hypothetical protein [Nonlabens xylanidelens]PPK92810.1 hypothetical protein LY01_02898 [Nonlabens xylanidelens]PQJ19852.1 hypothetical protein BST94_06325 [Nonlabens xylanidelens]
MKEVVNNVLQSANERIKNPFIFSFVVAWFAMNWEAIAIVFYSNESIDQRIVLANNHSDIYSTIIYPLLIALFYVIVLPYLMWSTEWLIKKAKYERKRNHYKEKADDWQGRTFEAVAERKYENARAGNAELSELNSKIEGLNNELENSNTEAQILRSKVDDAQKMIISLRAELAENKSVPREDYDLLINLDYQYNKFENSSSFKNFEKLAVSVNKYNRIPNDYSDLAIQKYIANDIIKRDSSHDDGFYFYYLTFKGEYFLKKYVKSLEDNDAIDLINTKESLR